MGRLIAAVAILAALIVFKEFYAADLIGLNYVSGANWPGDAGGFNFWFVVGMIGFISAHRGGDALFGAPVVFLGVGAVIAFFAARGANISEIAEARGPIILVLGLAIAYAARPDVKIVFAAAAVGGAVTGYIAGASPETQLGNPVYLGGFLSGVAMFLLGGIILAELCGRMKNGGGVRARLGAGAAGIGLYLTLVQFNVPGF